MRVAVVTESFLPQVNGVTNSVLRLLEFFDAYGHQAIVIAPESTQPIDSYLGFQVRRTPSLNFRKLIPIAIPNFTIRHFLEGFQPDIIHLASPTILGSYVLNVAEELNMPSISIYQTDVGGFARHYGLKLGSESLQRGLVRIHNKSTRTLAPSSSAAQDLINLGATNVHVLPRGVDLNRFNPAHRSEQLRLKWSDRGRKRIVGYMGRVANEKSIEDLSILNDDQQIQIVIIGDGPAKKKIQNALPGAIFLGQLSGNELAENLASFDIFVHTGRHETFCQSIQEALASGIPVVGPSTGGPLDLIIEGVNGHFFRPGNREELKAAVYSILEGEIDQYEFAARESVITRDWDSINRRLYEHYIEVLRIHQKNIEAQVVA